MTTLLQDLRYAIRTLVKTPGFTLVAVLTLAVGIGATTAIFSVIRAVLLKPLPYADADRLVGPGAKWPNLNAVRAISVPDYLDWAKQNTVFERIAAVSWGSVTVGEGSQPVYVNGSLVSAAYFDVFGLRPALGRTFAPDEDQPGRENVVVLSHHLWASQFGSDPAVVGKPIRLDGEAYTVIGIMPARTSVDSFDPQLWRPLTFDVLPPRGARVLQRAVAKLKDGVTLAQARAEMDAIGARLAREYPESNKGFGVLVESFPRPVGQESIRKTVAAFDRDQALADLKTLNQLKTEDVAPDRLRSILFSTFAAIAVGLAAMGLYGVIAHVIVQRTREIGIRAALGASKVSLLGLVMRQAIAIIALGLGVGVGASLAVTRVLTTFLYGVGPSNPRTIAAAAGLLTCVALIACWIPAQRATRVDPMVALRYE